MGTEKNTVIEKDTVFVASATKKESNSNDKNGRLKPGMDKEKGKAKLPKTAIANNSLLMALLSLVGLGLTKKRK